MWYWSVTAADRTEDSVQLGQTSQSQPDSRHWCYLYPRSGSVRSSHQTDSHYILRQWFPNTQQSRFLTACRRLEKLVLPSTFDTIVFHPWWCETCRVIEQKFWMKECNILWSQNVLSPLHIFRGSRPHPRRTYPLNATQCMHCCILSSTKRRRLLFYRHRTSHPRPDRAIYMRPVIVSCLGCAPAQQRVYWPCASHECKIDDWWQPITRSIIAAINPALHGH